MSASQQQMSFVRLMNESSDNDWDFVSTMSNGASSPTTASNPGQHSQSAITKMENEDLAAMDERLTKFENEFKLWLKRERARDKVIEQLRSRIRELEDSKQPERVQGLCTLCCDRMNKLERRMDGLGLKVDRKASLAQHQRLIDLGHDTEDRFDELSIRMSAAECSTQVAVNVAAQAKRDTQEALKTVMIVETRQVELQDRLFNYSARLSDQEGEAIDLSNRLAEQEEENDERDERIRELTDQLNRALGACLALVRNGEDGLSREGKSEIVRFVRTGDFDEDDVDLEEDDDELSETESRGRAMSS